MNADDNHDGIHNGDNDVVVDDGGGMYPPIEEEDIAVSPPATAVNWDDRLDEWEGGEELPPPQHHQIRRPVVVARAPHHHTNFPYLDNLPRPHAAYLFGGEDPDQQLARRQRFELFCQKRKQVLIGVSIIAASVLMNFIVSAMFSVAITASQFTYINANGTQIHVFLWGEGVGRNGVYGELSPLPECMGGFYRSILIDVIVANTLSVLAIFFAGMSCSCATKPWRFTRPLLLLGASIFGAIGTYLLIVQYGMGCDGDMRWYKAGSGSVHMLIGTILCFVLSLASFAQVSRYPLREVPTWQLLVGDYVDVGESDGDGGASGDENVEDEEMNAVPA